MRRKRRPKPKPRSPSAMALESPLFRMRKVKPRDLVFDREEWQAIYIVHHREAPPAKPPTINTILRMMAGFGGFLGRKYDGEPDPQTVWIG